VEGLSYDWDKVIGRSRSVADRLAGGIEFLFKKNGVDYIRGEATLESPGKVAVTDSAGAKTVHETTDILVATGCVSPVP